MTSTEAALKTAKGAVLPDTLMAKTGRTAGDTASDLTMLMISGKAEESGGRWKWTGAASTPRAKAKRGSKKPPVMVKTTPSTGQVILKGKGFTVRKGGGKGTDAPYPVETCSVRFKDPATGRWAKTPKDQKPGTLRKGKTGGMILTRSVTEHADGSREVTSARVILGEARVAQRRGKLKKSAVREQEKELSHDLLASSNPGLAASVHNTRMGEAHRSAKSTRGAATRKVKATLKKHRTAAAIRTDHLKAQADRKAAQEKLDKATTPTSRGTHSAHVRNLNLKMGRLTKEAKDAGVSL